MSGNYVVYHLHSDLSNGVTNIDSVTKYQQYIDKAQECGMRAMAFSEHGSIFEWWHKKTAIEKAGMKYIHATEAYITQRLDEKVRDNYHCVLIAKDLQGFYELNRMMSKAFNRKDNHFYYAPRISMDELFATSEHIIITTACIGGILSKGDQECQQRMIDFCVANSNRCFLEIGHHMDERQIEYNRKLYEMENISRQTFVLNALIS